MSEAKVIFADISYENQISADFKYMKNTWKSAKIQMLKWIAVVHFDLYFVLQLRISQTDPKYRYVR